MTGPTKAIAASLGMTAFVVACLAGMLADNPADIVLRHALASMLVLYVLGAVVGSVGMYVVTRHVEDYKHNTPVPNPAHLSGGHHTHSNPHNPHNRPGTQSSNAQDSPSSPS